MIKRNIKRSIIFLIIIVFLLFGVLIPENIIIRIIFVGLALLIISLIIFSKNSQSESQSKSAEPLSEMNTDLGSLETIPDEEEKILTDVDLQELNLRRRISPFIPKDLNEEYKRIANESIPSSASVEIQFNFILEKTLEIIKHVFSVYSAIFFWYRKDKNQIIFHNFVSDEPNVQKIKYPIGSDIISKVILSGNPNYTCNINSNVEADLIKYYQLPIGIKSVAAVPVFLNEKVIGVLAIDSKSEDAFGPETIYTLGKFVRIITLLLSIYDEKFSIELVNQKLDSVLEFVGNSGRELNENKLIQNFILMIDKFIEWDILGIVLYDFSAKNYILRKLINRTSIDYVGEGLPVDVRRDTLVGTSIHTGNSIRIDDTGLNKYFIFRKNVHSSIKGSLMIVPINSGAGILGTIVLESLKKKLYTDEDVRLIEKLGTFFASHLDNLFNKKLLKTYLSIDLETMLYTRETFEKKVQEELLKFKSTDVYLGLALISVDKIDKIINKYSSKVIPKIARHIALQLSNEAEELMYIGRLDNLKYGVLFINRDNASDNIWLQKILQKISGKSISFLEHEFAITVSIGYAGGIKLNRSETLFNSAEIALSKAILDGGNKIRTTK